MSATSEIKAVAVKTGIQDVHLPDPDDAPFDAEIAIDAAEYARIMRRIGADDGDGIGVSAFNSSI